MKKRWMKILSVGLCVTMAAGTVWVGQMNSGVTAYADDSKSSALQNVITDSAGVDTKNSSTDGKDETVYVIGDANGNNNDVIVSDWLKNGSSANTITDKTDLSDVTNVKGYEDYTKGKDGTITWNAKGSDIYYQGKTDKDLPVTVKVSYKLDGKDIAPADLAGKSGHVEIHFDYINNTKETAQLDGADTDIQVPFTMMTGVVLPTDTFTNVEIDHGKLISEGNNTVAVGYAFPGLKDSLNIDKYKDEIKDDTESESDDSASDDSADDSDTESEDTVKDLDIPEAVTISADAVDFKLDMTMTVALPDALSDLDFTNVDTSKIKDDMDELADNSKKLVDGTSDLDNGVSDLQDGTGDLKDGTKDLKKGTNDLLTGVNKLQNGASDLQNGACQLSSGANTLYSGTTTLNSGASTLASGASTLASGTGSLKSGANDLASGAGKLKTGANDLKNGTSALNSKTKTMPASVNELNDGAQQLSSGLSNLSAQSVSLVDGINQLKSGADIYAGVYSSQSANFVTVQNSLTPAIVGDGTAANPGIMGAVGDAYSKLSGYATQTSPTSSNEVENAAGQASDLINTLNSEKSDAQAVIDSCGDPASLSGDSAAAYYKAQGQIEIINSVLDQLESIQNTDSSAQQQVEAAGSAQQDAIDAAVQELGQVYNKKAQIKALTDGAASYMQNASTGFATLDGGLAKLALSVNDTSTSYGLEKGTAALAAGAAKLAAGTKQLSGSTQVLASAIQSIDTGAGSIQTGITSLDAGASKLNSGAADLNTGAEKLSSGASSLASGTSSLQSGASTLANGASTLANGTVTLKNGVDDLHTGSVSLNNGAGDLDDGVQDLVDGVKTLKDGSSDLKEGMAKFDKEGIQKLKKIFGDDVDDVLNRLDVVKDAGSAYTNFSGAADNTDASVKFIYKTAEIK